MTVSYSRGGRIVTEAEAKAIDAGTMRAPDPESEPEDYERGGSLPPELRDPVYMGRAAQVLDMNGFSALANVIRVELMGEDIPSQQPQPVQPVISPVVASQLAVTPVVVPPIPMGGTQPGGTLPAAPETPVPAPEAAAPAPVQETPATPSEGQPQG